MNKVSSSELSNKFISKEAAEFISGIAILFMIFHHTFGFKDYLLPEYGWNSFLGSTCNKMISIVAGGGNICVSIFAFLTGYAIWIKSESYKSIGNSLKKITKFLYKFWIITAIFIIIGIVCRDVLPNFSDLLLNLIGLKVAPDKPWINVVFSWYVLFYSFIILIAPLLIKIIGSDLKIAILVFVGILSVWQLALMSSESYLPVLYTNLMLWPLPAFFMGLLIAKYEDKIIRFRNCLVNRTLSLKPPAIQLTIKATMLTTAVILLFSILFLRSNLYSVVSSSTLSGGGNMLIVNRIIDAISTFIIIFVITISYGITKLGFITQIAVLLGTESLNIWFLHGLFFTGQRRLQHLVFWSTEPLVQFSLIVIISLVMSLLVTRILYLIFTQRKSIK